MADKRKSVIWLFFTLGEDTKFAKYNTCKEMVDTGGLPKLLPQLT